jgi:hypothetical protein
VKAQEREEPVAAVGDDQALEGLAGGFEAKRSHRLDAAGRERVEDSGAAQEVGDDRHVVRASLIRRCGLWFPLTGSRTPSF